MVGSNRKGSWNKGIEMGDYLGFYLCLLFRFIRAEKLLANLLRSLNFLFFLLLHTWLLDCFGSILCFLLILTFPLLLPFFKNLLSEWILVLASVLYEEGHFLLGNVGMQLLHKSSNRFLLALYCWLGWLCILWSCFIFGLLGINLGNGLSKLDCFWSLLLNRLWTMLSCSLLLLDFDRFLLHK